MMAVMAGGFFMLTLLLSPSRGLVANLRRQHRNRRSLLATSCWRGWRGSAATHQKRPGPPPDWDDGDVSEALQNAPAPACSKIRSRRIALTDEGQDTAHRVAESNAATR
jgi:hypothetical protein